MDYTGTFDGTEDAVQLADKTREHAYTPFHRPKEGAVLITEDGHGIVGSRVENSGYTQTRHAVETALGDALPVDDDLAYLVVSTDEACDASFLRSKPDMLKEFVDGDFPVIVHEDSKDVRQYTVDQLIENSGGGNYQGETPDDIGGFTVEAPYTTVEAEDAVDRVDAWRDAAYDELRDRLSDIKYVADDPMADVMREAKDAFYMADEKPDDVLAELWGHAQEAQEHAHEPYSNYPVGVSVLTRDGRVFTGQNMEDHDISHTMHGEGNAVTTAVTWELERGDVSVLAVHSESETAPFFCGQCRQVTAEFADEDTVIGALGKDGSDVEEYSTLGRHLPDMFRL